MTHSWIWLSIFAAGMQTVRTAAQKRLTDHVSTLAVTYVRALFGLPVMLVYLGLVLEVRSAPVVVEPVYLAWCFVAALTQNIGTAALLTLYRVRNFAVANQLARSNVVFTAVLGALFFTEIISAAGWAAIGLTMAGVALLSLPGAKAAEQSAIERVARGTDIRAVLTGLLIGLMFGLCNLSIRSASLTLLPADATTRGAVTVAVVTAMQVVMLGLWLAVREPGFMRSILRHPLFAAFIGLTSAAGSIAWFTAFSLANASYVIAVGQIEVAFGVLVSVLYFREHVSRAEVIGIGVMLAGVLLLHVAG